MLGHLSQYKSLMEEYLNAGQIGSIHFHKTHCSFIILSLEAVYFDIKSVLNITKIFYVKINMSTFCKEKVTGGYEKMQLNQMKIENY